LIFYKYLGELSCVSVLVGLLLRLRTFPGRIPNVRNVLNIPKLDAPQKEEVTCPELETANVPGTEVGVGSVVVVVVVDIDVSISQYLDNLVRSPSKALVFRVGNSGAVETTAEAHFTGTMVCRETRGADHATPAFRAFVAASAGKERHARHGTVVAGSGELHAGNYFCFCFERELVNFLWCVLVLLVFVENVSLYLFGGAKPTYSPGVS
jgi:hypothetical protein